MNNYNGYTPRNVCEELESKGIKVGPKQLHAILRMKNIIDSDQKVIDKEKYGKYFSFEWTNAVNPNVAVLRSQ